MLTTRSKLLQIKSIKKSMIVIFPILYFRIRKLQILSPILLTNPYRYAFIPRTFMCEPMGRREIFSTFSLLVEIEGHFTNEFVSYRYRYVYETDDWF
jgi:hypothetical protein